jgi:glycine betaine/proline transport system substrate-binding protein
LRPEVNSYPVSRAFTLMTRSFASRSGPVTTYLKTRKWDNQTINQVLAWQDENHESNEDAAIHFLRNYEGLWMKWVPADVAEKVKASL